MQFSILFTTTLFSGSKPSAKDILCILRPVDMAYSVGINKGFQAIYIYIYIYTFTQGMNPNIYIYIYIGIFCKHDKTLFIYNF